MSNKENWQQKENWPQRENWENTKKGDLPETVICSNYVAELINF